MTARFTWKRLPSFANDIGSRVSGQHGKYERVNESVDLDEHVNNGSLDSEDVTSQGLRPPSKSVSRYEHGRRYRYPILAVLLLIVPFVLWEAWPSSDDWQDGRAETSSFRKAVYFHVVMQGEKTSKTLCRNLVAAAALDYPTPALTNWHAQNDQAATADPVTDFDGVWDFLDSMERSRGDDLVIIVDAANSLFQLRPQVLLDRYFAANDKANKRIRKKYGQKSVEQYRLHQDVLFMTSESCSALTPQHPPCVALPKSALSDDLQRREYPLFLSPSITIGPVRSLLKIYNEATTHQDSVGQWRGEPVFGDLLVAQEGFRNQIIERKRFSTRLKAWFSKPAPIVGTEAFMYHPNGVTSTANIPLAKRDYGIGVDLDRTIGMSVPTDDNNIAWTVRQDTNSLWAASEIHKVPVSKFSKLQTDIAESLPPFWTFATTKLLHRETPWQNVSLLTDLRNGHSPAVVHMELPRDNKDRADQWWHRMFLHPHARQLYTIRLLEPPGPVAISGPEGQTPREYWAHDNWRGGARKVDGSEGPYELFGSGAAGVWVRYDDMCPKYAKDVFLDDKGPWSLPEDH